jgi:hypothetical protein
MGFFDRCKNKFSVTFFWTIKKFLEHKRKVDVFIFFKNLQTQRQKRTFLKQPKNVQFFGVFWSFGRFWAFLGQGLDRTLLYYTLLFIMIFILNEIFFTIYGNKKYL